MYDKTEYFEETIMPMIQKLKAECFAAKIPLFVSCAVKDTGDATEYRNEMISEAQVCDCKLSDNKLTEYAKILNGFIAVPEEAPLELEFELSDSSQE